MLLFLRLITTRKFACNNLIIACPGDFIYFIESLNNFIYTGAIKLNHVISSRISQ